MPLAQICMEAQLLPWNGYFQKKKFWRSFVTNLFSSLRAQLLRDVIIKLSKAICFSCLSNLIYVCYGGRREKVKQTEWATEKSTSRDIYQAHLTDEQSFWCWVKAREKLFRCLNFLSFAKWFQRSGEKWLLCFSRKKLSALKLCALSHAKQSGVIKAFVKRGEKYVLMFRERLTTWRCFFLKIFFWNSWKLQDYKQDWVGQAPVEIFFSIKVFASLASRAYHESSDCSCGKSFSVLLASCQDLN